MLFTRDEIRYTEVFEVSLEQQRCIAVLQV